MGFLFCFSIVKTLKYQKLLIKTVSTFVDNRYYSAQIMYFKIHPVNAKSSLIYVNVWHMYVLCNLVRLVNQFIESTLGLEPRDL